MTAQRKRKGKKSGVPKASISKLSNKRLNKLAKQGKLKKSVGRKKLVDLLKRRTNHTESDREELPQDIPLEEADYEYFDKPGRNFSFLTELASSDENKQRKRKRNDDDFDNLEGKYEKQLKKPATEKNVEVKQLLPLISIGKGKGKGLIPQTREVEIIEEKEEENEVEAFEASDTMNLPVTALEEVVQEKLKLKEAKDQIKKLALAITMDPQEHVRKLKELAAFVEDKSRDIPRTVCRFALISLKNLYKDIIPGYRIRILTDVEKKQSMKKDTKKVNDYEEALVNYYHHFLEILEILATGKSSQKKTETKKKPTKKAKKPVDKKMRLLSVTALCELLVAHPHFNFRTEVMSTVLRFITHGDAELSDVVCETVKELFANDKQSEASLEVVRLIGRVIKVKNFEVKPKVLDTFLALKIKEVAKPHDKDKEKKMTKEEKMKKFSKRERKRQKAMEHLEAELRSAAAEQSVKQKLKLNTEIINTIYLTYFRILKYAQRSRLLASVLEGLAKFGHLINITFFDSLFAELSKLVTTGELSTRCSLNCVQTATTLLTGLGEALNVDPVRFYNHLYQVLLKLHAGNSKEDLQIATRCLDVLLTKRRRHVSEQRIFAFLKRLATVALQMSSDDALVLIDIVRKTISDFQKADILMSTETIGCGVFMPELDEPDYCNACNASLYELHLLRKSYHPGVSTAARNLLKGSSKQ